MKEPCMSQYCSAGLLIDGFRWYSLEGEEEVYICVGQPSYLHEVLTFSPS